MAKLYINPSIRKGHINPELQGHFSEHLGRCIYEGLYVGEDSPIPNTNGIRNDVVEALREIHVPVLRWPGGCFADEYHWKDGIGPKESRKKMINTHWGGVVEDNSFGTHEFMELCRQLGCKAYVNGNLGSGTVQEMSEWVEYMTFDGVSPMADLRAKNGHEKPWHVDYFGVGNESWGCGGNMLPEQYGMEYRRYQTYVRNYDPENPVKKIACGPSVDDYEWTEKVLETTSRKVPERVHCLMDGLSLHHYTVPGTWESKGSACDFTGEQWYKTMYQAWYMDELVRRHSAIMDKYDPEGKIGLIVDEWGCWFDVEEGTNPGFLYQQNTIRDALVAGLTLNIFNKHCSRVKMANIAQMVNVLQSVILTEGEKMLKTPTWHVFDLYQVHQDTDLVESFLETEMIGPEDASVPSMTESASIDADGVLHVTMTNQSLDADYPVELSLATGKAGTVKGCILTGEMNAKNTFEDPNHVHSIAFDAFEATDNGVSFTLPRHSVLRLDIPLE